MKRQYKDSGIPWIREIPSDWGVEQLSGLFIEHKNKNSDLSETNLLSLSYGKIIRKDINTKEGLLPQSFDGYNVIEKGDIVFRLTDLQNDKRSLRTGLCTERGIITSAYVTLRKRQDLDSAFFHYLFHSYDICKVFYGLGDGVRQGMNYSDLRKLAVLYPPHPTQQRIADFLDRKCAEIDELAALQQTMIAELKRYKQSVITEAVTKGFDPNVPMKDSGVEWIGKIPEGWEVRKLRTLGKFSASGIDKLIVEDEPLLQIINYVDVYNNLTHELRSKDYMIVSASAEKKREHQVCVGDMIFTPSSETTDDIGVSSVVMEELPNTAYSYHVLRFRSNEEIKLHYKKYICNNSFVSQYFSSKCNGTIRKTLSREVFKECKVLLPPLAEQRSIADYLDKKCAEIDELIAIKQQKIEALKEYKKSVIFEYVTGKKEVEG